MIRRVAYGAFLGVAFTLAGWDFMTWQFYAAIVPAVLLVEWKCSK